MKTVSIAVRAGAAAGLAALAACSATTTAPLSYLDDRQVTQRAVLHRYPVFVTSIDGSSTTFRPVPISPGDHVVGMDAPAVGLLTQPVHKEIPMTIAPCTQYEIAAQRDSAFEQDWRLVVENTFPVGGCDPAREMQKARVGSADSSRSTLVGAIATQDR